MRLNDMFGRCLKVEEDEKLRKMCINELLSHLNTDQVLWKIEKNIHSPYQAKLKDDHTRRCDKLVQFMKDRYNVELKMFDIWDTIHGSRSFPTIKEELENMDPYILSWMYTIATSLRSTILSIALLNDFVSIDEAIDHSRLEELYRF